MKNTDAGRFSFKSSNETRRWHGTERNPGPRAVGRRFPGTESKRERQAARIFLSHRRKSVGRNKRAPCNQPKHTPTWSMYTEHTHKHDGNDIITQGFQKTCKSSSHTPIPGCEFLCNTRYFEFLS